MTTTNDQPAVEESPHDPATWFRGKTRDELLAIEFQGRNLIPSAWERIGPKGERHLTPCMLRPPTDHERALGRLDAMAHVREVTKRRNIKTVDQARAAVGTDIFENWDSAGIVSRCCLEVEPPHGRQYLLPVLLETFQLRQYQVMFERLTFLAQVFDPKLPQMTEPIFWAAVEAINRGQNVSPLVGMHGDELSSFIVRTASELCSSRTRSSASPSPETSTPVP